MTTKLIPRSNAYSPRSIYWTLYKPEILAEKLKIPLDVVDTALEETGFLKAVKIRELIIKWKTRLLSEQKDLHFERDKLQRELGKVSQREKEVSEMLVEIRNILRIPRERTMDNDKSMPSL